MPAAGYAYALSGMTLVQTAIDKLSADCECSDRLVNVSTYIANATAALLMYRLTLQMRRPPC
ncbi:MAG: hypothetical protein V7L21_19515 [Nostoc sp.]|uniref:hypothetical protein n=1 Tax=Nostoc sp. TaxID=1180 RepID=UPI002FF47F7B